MNNNWFLSILTGVSFTAILVLLLSCSGTKPVETTEQIEPSPPPPRTERVEPEPEPAPLVVDKLHYSDLPNIIKQRVVRVGWDDKDSNSQKVVPGIIVRAKLKKFRSDLYVAVPIVFPDRTVTRIKIGGAWTLARPKAVNREKGFSILAVAAKYTGSAIGRSESNYTPKAGEIAIISTTAFEGESENQTTTDSPDISSAPDEPMRPSLTFEGARAAHFKVTVKDFSADTIVLSSDSIKPAVLTSTDGELAGFCIPSTDGEMVRFVDLADIEERFNTHIENGTFVFRKSYDSIGVDVQIDARLGLDEWSRLYFVEKAKDEVDPHMEHITNPSVDLKKGFSSIRSSTHPDRLAVKFSREAPLGESTDYVAQVVAKKVDGEFVYFPTIRYSVSNIRGNVTVEFEGTELFPNKKFEFPEGEERVVSDAASVKPGAKIINLIPIAGGEQLLVQQTAEPFIRVLDFTKNGWMPDPDVEVNADTVLAANADHLYTFDKKLSKIRKIRLDTWETVDSKTIELTDPILTMACAPVKDSPIIVASKSEYWFINSQNLTTMTWGAPTKLGSRTELVVNAVASGDGSCFGIIATGLPSSKESSIRRNTILVHPYEKEDGKIKKRSDRGQVYPSFEGYYYLEEKDIYNINTGSSSFTWKSVANYSIADHFQKSFLRIRGGDSLYPQIPPQVDYYGFPGQTEPICIIKSLSELSSIPTVNYNQELPNFKRIILLSGQNTIVTVPNQTDELLIRTFNAAQHLAEKSPEKIHFASVPPSSVNRNGDFNYQIKPISDTQPDQLSYSLIAGPTGSKLSSTGQLTWAVPGNYTASEADFAISISDGTLSGRQQFSVRIGGFTPMRVTSYEPADEIDEQREFQRAEKKLEISGQVIDFAEEINDARLGGAGKYLLVSHNYREKLSVIDLQSASLLKTLTLPATRARFTANSEDVFICYTDHNLIERRSLPSLEKEAISFIDSPNLQIIGLCAGSHTEPDKPLLLCFEKETPGIGLLHPETLKFEPAKEPFKRSNRPLSYWELNCSPNGTRATFYNFVVTIDKSTIKAVRNYNIDSVYPSLFSHDGSRLYHENEVIDIVNQRLREITTDYEVDHLIPDTSGLYFLGYRQTLKSLHATAKSDSNAKKAIMKVYSEKGAVPILTLTGFDEYDGKARINRSSHDAIFLISKINKLVTISREKKSVVIRSLDIKAAVGELN